MIREAGKKIEKPVKTGNIPDIGAVRNLIPEKTVKIFVSDLRAR